jgi:uncharacterized protein (UPF0332 family)
LTPEQAALLRKAHATYQGARLLADNGLYDAAVSRAYYAMFYIAEAFLLGDGLTFSKHSAVIGEFGHRFANTGRVPVEFHRYLLDGQDSRNKGDYDIGLGVTEAEAAEQIAHAAQFLELAERLIGPLPPSPGQNA